jgi:hypothetical protein
MKIILALSTQMRHSPQAAKQDPTTPQHRKAQAHLGDIKLSGEERIRLDETVPPVLVLVVVVLFVASSSGAACE